MCTPPNYCSYCLTRMKNTAIRNGDDVRANQLASYIAERKNLRKKPKTAVIKPIDLSKVSGKIAVDIDDTMGSFEMDMRLALARRDKLTYAEALIRYPENQPNGIADWWADSPDPGLKAYQEFEDLEARDLLYKDQPVREGAGDVVNWLHRETNGRVEFLTARPSAFNSISKKWLEDRVGIVFPIVIGNSTKKEEVEDFEVLIDDSVPHVKAVSSDDAPHGARKTVFMTRPRSSTAVSGEHVHAAWSWKDVKKIFSNNSKSS